MKIAIAGTFIADHIEHPDGTTTQSLGGITYTVAALASLVPLNVDVYPIAVVGEDIYERLENFTRDYPNVKLKYLHKLDAPNTRVNLRYYSKFERDEFLSFPLPPISIEHLSTLEKFDLVVLNYITGFEMSIESHQYFQKLASLIYMDYHSLTLGIDEIGKRFHRCPENWHQWLDGVHTLQMNEHEAKLLNNNETDYLKFADKVFNYGVHVLNITLGENGSLLLIKENAGKITMYKLPAVQFGDLSDVTGCGDAFAGGYISKILYGSDPVSAARFANRVAGYKSSFSGAEEMKLLSRFRHTYTNDDTL
jgi:sugar/nucleoside kinase (ribokinase family)